MIHIMREVAYLATSQAMPLFAVGMTDSPETLIDHLTSLDQQAGWIGEITPLEHVYHSRGYLLTWHQGRNPWGNDFAIIALYEELGAGRE